jgi:hypothetical protein
MSLFAGVIQMTIQSSGSCPSVGTVKNRPDCEVASVRFASSRLSKALVSCTNSVDPNHVVSNVIAGSLVGGLASMLLPVPGVLLSGTGGLAGAAMAFWEGKQQESRIAAYPERLKEIRYHPILAVDTERFPSDLSRCSPTQRANFANVIHEVYRHYTNSPEYLQAKESAKGLIAEFWKRLELEKNKYPAITFEKLSNIQKREVNRTIEHHPELLCVFQTYELEEGRGKIDILFTILEKNQPVKDIQQKRNEVIKAHEDACKQGGGDKVISLATLFSLRGVPFTHINPDPLPTTDAPRHDASASTSSDSQFPVQSAPALRQRRLKRAGVHPEPAAACTDPGSKRPAAAPVVITYGPVMQKQMQQGLPKTCEEGLNKIDQDLRSGRPVTKTVNGMLVLDINMGSGGGRGEWRLLVKKLPTPGATMPKPINYEVYGIVDYHTPVPGIW